VAATTKHQHQQQPGTGDTATLTKPGSWGWQIQAPSCRSGTVTTPWKRCRACMHCAVAEVKVKPRIKRRLCVAGLHLHGLSSVGRTGHLPVLLGARLAPSVRHQPHRSEPRSFNTGVQLARFDSFPRHPSLYLYLYLYLQASPPVFTGLDAN
jgi:hypothetical protein